MARTDTLPHFLTDVADAIRSKGGTSETIQASSFDTAIANLPSGGATGQAGESDVNFYDYDGSLLYSYKKSDFLALTELPSNPTHTGLTSRGWNWSLSDAKDYVTDYGTLDIGQMYRTTSGLTEIDVTVNSYLSTGLAVTLNMDGTKNWGDGTTDTGTTHTYASAGDYTITCDGSTINSRIFGQGGNDSTANYYAKNIRFGNNKTILEADAVTRCYSLKTVIIPDTITTINSGVFSFCNTLVSAIIPNSITQNSYIPFPRCSALRFIVLPNTNVFLNHSNSGLFQDCICLKKIIIPKNSTNLGTNFLYSCNAVSLITIPNSIPSFGNSAFSGTRSLTAYDFSNFTSIPSITTSTFSNSNQIKKIIVPDDLYTTWKTSGNWASISECIIKKSDWDAS